jgi:membrane-bound lytic murein transglycosylase
MFIAPPGAKALADASAAESKYHEQMRKEDEEKMEKHRTEVLKTLNPQEAIRYKAQIEEDNKREQQFRERSRSSPCQPLSSIFPFAP